MYSRKEVRTAFSSAIKTRDRANNAFKYGIRTMFFKRISFRVKGLIKMHIFSRVRKEKHGAHGFSSQSHAEEGRYRQTADEEGPENLWETGLKPISSIDEV